MLFHISLEVAALLGLLLINGLLAMAEIALVSARKQRLLMLAEAGNPRAKKALALIQEPTRFLSTVQVGMTLSSIFSGAFGGATLGAKLGGFLDTFPLFQGYGMQIGIVAITLILGYFTLIAGELVPKRLALSHPETISMWVAGPMAKLAAFAGPVVDVLTHSTDLFLKLVGFRKTEDPPISEAEVRGLIDQGMTAGIFHKSEKEMVESVLDFDRESVADLMTPRARIVWLNLDDSDEANWRKIAGSGHSNFPVYQGNRDQVQGIVSVKSLWANLSLAGQAELKTLVMPPLLVPNSMPANKLLETFRSRGIHIALVVDEFGGIAGLVTLNDLIEAIVGGLPDREQRARPQVLKREDGTWLVDALYDVDDFKQRFELPDLPGEEDEDFSTIGGFVLACLGHIPKEGESFTAAGLKFEVIDMDRHRVDKVLVTKLAPPPPPAAPAGEN
jgi:putative hemolysin